MIGTLFWLAFPFLLLVILITGKHRRGLSERLGCYRKTDTINSLRIWIHAASIGEISVARQLIARLEELAPETTFVLTTMTIHGRDFARSVLPASIPVYLAPLDVPLIVERAVRLVRPVVYVCLETELWPMLHGSLVRAGTASVLLNGRLSEKSIKSYLRFHFLFSPVVSAYDHIAAISEQDRTRFLLLGARRESVIVTGNVKDDTAPPAAATSVRNGWRRVLQIDGEATVIIAGSTHAPEEELLVPLIKSDVERARIWILAPRHLRRLEDVERLLAQQGLASDRLSRLKDGGSRHASVVLVDTMGDLASLYSVASCAFVGGSLTAYGGHNVMEAARWGTVVFFGPHTEDFQEAAGALAAGGGGIRVGSADELAEQLHRLLQDRREREERGRQAQAVAQSRRGAIETQARLVVAMLPHREGE